MAELSWLRTGGPAQWLYQPASRDDLTDFLRHLPPEIPVMPIGVCSNLIIRDGGIDGVVIRLGRGLNEIEIEGDEVIAGAAALDAHVAKRSAEAGLDLAFLRTIPGAIGGAVRMNAGCYGSYIADHFVSARAIDRQGNLHHLTLDDMGFAYRSTRFSSDLIVTDVTLRADSGEPNAITQKMEDALARRAESQPVDERSCGSTFRNPAGHSSTGQADDTHELKAWKVIDEAGLRGATLGGAQMSTKHPNFLINTGTATSADLEGLGEAVRKKVFETAGIQLEWEIKRIGKPSV